MKGFKTGPLEMTLDLEALVIAAYLFTDDYRLPLTCGRSPHTSDAELVA